MARHRHLAAALIFVVLTLLLTNPLAWYAWNAVEDKQDALLNTWIISWVGHALLTDPLNLYHTNIFYPYRNTLAFSEILLPQSLLALPLRLAGDNPIFAYNLVLLVMLWLDAFAMYLLVYDLTRRAEAGWIAGAIYAFNPFNLGNLAQLQLLALGWLPLTLFFLRRVLNPAWAKSSHASISHRLLVRSCTARYAFLFALFFILQSLSSFYYALLAGLAVGLYVLWWSGAQGRGLFAATRRRAYCPSSRVLRVGASAMRGALLPLIAACGLITLLLIPFLRPYVQVQNELGFQRRVQESEPFSASLRQFVQVAPENVIYGRWLAPNPVTRIGGYPLDNLFPGMIGLVLAVGGAVARRSPRERWYFILLLPCAFILALGPRLYLTPQQPTELVLPYRWLYEHLAPLRALRAPVRFDALINLSLAALAGIGAAERRRDASTKRLYAAALACIALEYLALPAAHTATLPVASQVPSLYRWLARQPPAVALELPMMGPNAQGELDLSTQYFTTYHWHATPDGYSGFVPPRRGEIAYEMQFFPSARAIALARALDVHYLIVHDASKCHNALVGLGVAFEFEGGCVFEVMSVRSEPRLDKRLYVPSSVAAGAPFTAYLILRNRGTSPFAVKPTDRVDLEAIWNDGRSERLSVEIPLVTSSASVVPLTLGAPSRAGRFELRLRAAAGLIGSMDTKAFVQVGAELAREVVLPASVALRKPLAPSYARGAVLRVALTWLPLNKINAYYSASVRLVDENGNKITNVDRQPRVPTLLWQPDTPVDDEFELGIPLGLAPANYRVELLMYQGNTGQSALLLDREFEPQPVVELGEIEVE